MTNDQLAKTANPAAVNRLRILFVPWDRFPPFRPAAKAIFLNELPNRGHRIDWLIQADESSPDAKTLPIKNGFAYIGATDAGVRLVNRIRKHFRNFKHACRAVKLVRENDYHLVQAKDNFSTALIAAMAGRLAGIKFFYWIAYPHPEAYILEGRQRISRYPTIYLIRGYILKFVLYKMILRMADHVFVQSEKMLSDIELEGIAREKMTPVPSSVDLESIPYLAENRQEALPEKGDKKWAVYLGTLKRVRKLDFIIRSFARVLTEEPNAVLYIIGSGDRDSDLQFLHDVSIELGIEKSVIFTGYLRMTLGWEYIRRADVCLSPYFPTPILQSTSPTKLVEYMAMGKAVVANDHPEQSDIIEHSRAGVCVPWEESKFSDAIVHVLKNPEEARQMGLRGRAYVEEFRTNRAMGDLVESVYLKNCFES